MSATARWTILGVGCAVGLAVSVWAGTTQVGHPTARWLWHDVLGVVD